MQFQPFPKIPRLFRDIVISEKIDGSNASILIIERALVTDRPANIVAEDSDYVYLAGSRNKWVVPGKGDNYGFAGWVASNIEKLHNLGPGHHFGEWWGQGIQRNYGLKERRFSLFNTHRWGNHDEEGAKVFFEKFGCYVVPQLYEGPFDMFKLDETGEILRAYGSKAAPGFMKPEGVIMYHKAADALFKVLLENDEIPKGLVKNSQEVRPEGNSDQVAQGPQT